MPITFPPPRDRDNRALTAEIIEELISRRPELNQLIYNQVFEVQSLPRTELLLQRSRNGAEYRELVTELKEKYSPFVFKFHRNTFALAPKNPHDINAKWIILYALYPEISKENRQPETQETLRPRLALISIPYPVDPAPRDNTTRHTA